jgi:hypothetical protein
MFSIGLPMKDLRRRRLIALFNSPRFKGDRAKLIKATGLTKGRIAQLFDEKSAFGEAAARSLAERLHLPGDYFERDVDGATDAAAAQDGALSPAEQDLLNAFRALPDDERLELVRDVMAAAERYNNVVQRALAERGIDYDGYASATRAAEKLPPAPPASAAKRQLRAAVMFGEGGQISKATDTSKTTPAEKQHGRRSNR